MMEKNSRKLFMSSIIEILKHKPLEEITVTEIVYISGLSRQSFYDNFSDKFDLVNKTFFTDAEKSMRLFSNKEVSWNSVILTSLDTMKSKKSFYTNVLKYKGQNSLSEYFADYIIKVHSKLIFADMLNNSSNEKALGIIQFHAYGTAWTTTNWAVSGMKAQPKEMSALIYECMPNLMRQSYTNIF